ncbi:Zn(II)2Cys6 transcription factor domain-containing protein [Aspergillus ibericus CBS 121593]|uniref:C6 transcription factor n=1 Tax=Aspergillus ibericus CBS 121593 TaxID=1448316 RepID=A0A395H836_9EURO|nr:C6 transcription factor [Aspergillus ibericus CBS 121593]RAL03673.1 C6 transcription factor [Aspergillus ibericus CBS 121593]
MAPRRTHTKSRNGCDQCKKRRVKCDEQGPPCSNCMSRELKCTYFNIPGARKEASLSASTPVPVQSLRKAAPSEPPTHTSQPLSRHGASPLNFASLRELELMHKFSTETYQSLCNEPTDHQVWQSVIPRKALEYSFLMSGILAVASLHIASELDPPAALSYIDTALEYHDLAFAPFRQAIDNLTPANCDAVFAHSVITTVIGIALPQLAAVREETQSMTENIIVVFELLHGTTNIFSISRPWLQDKLFTSRRGFWETPLSILDSETEAALDRLTALNNDMLAGANAEQHSIIKNAIALLRRCFCRYNHNRDVASILAWVATVDKEFVQALRCRQPLALLVLLHWGALLHELDGKVWWANNSGRALVSELQNALRPCDVRWEGALQWPKRKLGL